MKVLVIWLVLLGLHNVPTSAAKRKSEDIITVQPKNLNGLLQQFLKFIPMDEEVKIFMNYLESDPDVQKAILFLYSDSFANLVYNVDNSSTYKEFLKYLYESGVDIYTYVNILHDMLELPHINTPAPPIKRSFADSGLIRMMKEMLALLPIQEIWQWYENVCFPDPDFQKLLLRIRSPEFKQLLEDVHNSAEYKELTDILLTEGIDVDTIEKMISDFLNGNGFIRMNFIN